VGLLKDIAIIDMPIEKNRVVRSAAASFERGHIIGPKCHNGVSMLVFSDDW
jgi:hypothetical protein